jgi:hypothetical protein
MHPTSRLAVAVLLALGLAAPAVAAEDGSVAVPRHTCKKPEYPGRLASDTQKRNFRKDVDVYAECIKKYVAVQQKNAESFVKAGNTAIDEYNAAVKDFQEQSK